MAQSSETDKIRADFIENVGLIVEREGLPNLAVPMFGMFDFYGDTVLFGELADRLQISHGSVSSSVRILEVWEILKRLTKSGERQDYFHLSPEPFENALKHAIGVIR